MDYTKYFELADYALDKIETIDPNCIVAGGMPRDIDNGKPVSDIDLFFYVDPVLTNNQVYTMLTKLGFEIITEKAGENIPEQYKMNPKLMSVFETKVEDIPVQLMRMSESTFTSVVEQFPLSICQCYYKNGKIKTHNLYKRCKAKKVIVKTNSIYNSEHAFLQKILTKYNDWEYLGD